MAAAGGASPSVGAIAAIRDDRGRVLLVRQLRGPFAGAWLLPGGGVERDEGVVHAVARELREETGLTLAGAHFVACYQVMSEPPGAFDITVFMYAGDASGALTAEAGGDVRWFAPGGIPDPHPMLLRQLADAGIASAGAAAIDASLAAAGIRVERLA
ncbi:MAG TPA: NUDIX hydrolase [Candidatus Limnocylindria bacterium]|nr:NUDIX hydrolase [Candidatus Limnocylindria bacterium]